MYVQMINICFTVQEETVENGRTRQERNNVEEIFNMMTRGASKQGRRADVTANEGEASSFGDSSENP